MRLPFLPKRSAGSAAGNALVAGGLAAIFLALCASRLLLGPSSRHATTCSREFRTIHFRCSLKSPADMRGFPLVWGMWLPWAYR